MGSYRNFIYYTLLVAVLLASLLLSTGRELQATSSTASSLSSSLDHRLPPPTKKSAAGPGPHHSTPGPFNTPDDPIPGDFHLAIIGQEEPVDNNVGEHSDDLLKSASHPLSLLDSELENNTGGEPETLKSDLGSLDDMSDGDLKEEFDSLRMNLVNAREELFVVGYLSNLNTDKTLEFYDDDVCEALKYTCDFGFLDGGVPSFPLNGAAGSMYGPRIVDKYGFPVSTLTANGDCTAFDARKVFACDNLLNFRPDRVASHALNRQALKHLKEKCVRLEISSAKLHDNTDLSQGDGNMRYPEQRRCVIFRTN